MKRLTCLCGNDYQCNIDEDACQSEETCEYCTMWQDIIDRLAEYENSGLEPEDVQKVADFMKLFPKLCEKYILNDKEEIG